MAKRRNAEPNFIRKLVYWKEFLATKFGSMSIVENVSSEIFGPITKYKNPLVNQSLETKL